MEQMNDNNQSKVRLNIKQTAKKEKYWDITVRGDTAEEVGRLFSEVKTVAEKECQESGDEK